MKQSFKKFATGLGLSAALVSASLPSLAGKDFYKQDLRNETTELAQVIGQRLSDDKLAFVVHGGNKKLMMAAYRVAQRLDDENIPVAFLLAPDRDALDWSMHVDYYAKGGTKFGLTAYDNEKITIAQTEADLYRQAMKAYKDGFKVLASNDTESDKRASLMALVNN